MLIKKSSIQFNDIVTLKINTGEEVVGKLVSDTSTYNQSADWFTLANPIIVGGQVDQHGKVQVGFGPFSYSVDDHCQVTFLRSSLMTLPMPTRDEIVKAYYQATSSIALPPSGLII